MACQRVSGCPRGQLLESVAWVRGPYLVREGKGELDLIRHSISVASALCRCPESRRRGASCGTSNAESVHGGMMFLVLNC